MRKHRFRVYTPIIHTKVDAAGHVRGQLACSSRHSRRVITSTLGVIYAPRSTQPATCAGSSPTNRRTNAPACMLFLKATLGNVGGDEMPRKLG